MRTLDQAMQQCVSARTAAQCSQALPACGAADRAISAFAASYQLEQMTDRLLTNRARCEDAVGRYASAEQHYRRLLRLRQYRYGPEHTEVGINLNNLALTLEHQGKLGEAEVLYRTALALQERLLGPEHPEVATSLNNLATVLVEAGRPSDAEAYLHRALAVLQKRLGPENPALATTLNNLAVVLESQRSLGQAETLHRKALALRARWLGPEHPDIAQSLHNLAAVLDSQAKYWEAAATYREALALCQRLLGPEHPDVASNLNNLAAVLESIAEFGEAEALHRQALALRQKSLGPAHPDVAISLNNLASVLENQGKLDEAEGLNRQALALRQRLLAPEHPLVASSLDNLAVVLHRQGKLDEAEALNRQALALRQRRLGVEHPDIAISLNNLASALDSQGKLTAAESLYRQALELRKKHLGPEHPDVAQSLSNLAYVLSLQGRMSEAEALHRQVLALLQKQLSPMHPTIAFSLVNLAMFYLGQGIPAQALPLLQQAVQIHEVQVRSTVSETRMQALIDTLRREEDATYGLLLGPDLPGATELALQVALLRKGRVAAAGATANLTAQRSLAKPEIAQRFSEWQGIRQQYEGLVYGGPGRLLAAEYRQRLHDSRLRAESLEAQLAQALPELRGLQPPPMDHLVAQVAARMRTGSALVEVVWTKPYQGRSTVDGKPWGMPHYVAPILFPDRRIESVDLGEAATVDTLALELQTALASPRTDPVSAAKLLHAQVIGRLQAKLRGVRELFLSLDGTLHTIPFDALHDGTDYLLGRYRFHYLTSGRDLLRERSQRVASAPLLLANPDFGQVAAGGPKDGGQNFYRRLAGLSALPGTQREAMQIAPLLGVEPLMGAQATEPAVRGVHAPRILHIATHGLFLQDVHLPPPTLVSDDARGVSAREQDRSKLVGAAEAERLPGEIGAMNRSALVLPDVLSAYLRGDAARDGLLTADEARSLDLDGTQLVVLSACDTGRGGLSAGQGVYGLRRAFLVAGAETLVTSLWQVSDAATGELMPLYYQKLLDKQKPGDRLGAMVEAMQELRRKPGRSHPYYWAPFLVIGSDGPLH